MNYDGSKTDDEEELNRRVENLEGKIRSLVDKHAPVKIFKTDSKRVNWMTNDLLERIERRNTLRSKLDKEGGSSEQWRRWKTLRNKVNKDIKTAKRDHMKSKLENNMESSKTLWDGVKEYLGWKSSGAPELLVKETGEVVQSPLEL